MRDEKKYTAVGSYIFAGGFTLGVERHFNIRAHLEDGPYGVKTFTLNRPEVPVWLDPEEWPDAFDVPIDFIYCNPPCALFSVMGKSLTRGVDNWKTDPRRACWERSFSHLERFRPHFLAIESVPLALTRGREMLNDYAKRAGELGYAVTHLLEDARWHGLPQKRPRYIFLAHDMAFLPERTNWAPPPSVAEVLETVPAPGFHYPLNASLLSAAKACPQGRGLREAWEKLNPPETWVRGLYGVKGRPRFAHHRVRADEPMGAYVGDFFVHPTEDRNLGVEEAKAVCGFPKEWRFHNERQAFSELARGVMPPVADWLARSVKQSLDIGEAFDLEDEPLILDLRKPPI